MLPARHRLDLREGDVVDTDDVLDRLDRLDVRTWVNVGGGERRTEHLGPAAEDFHDVFECGEAADRIAAGDTDGVALAGIQGLVDRIDELRSHVERQDRRIDRQRGLLEEQRQDIETLRERLESLQAEVTRLEPEQ